MPKDAVTSMLMCHPELSVDLALWNYINYYQAIKPVIDQVVLAPYEQIMDNPAQLFAQVNKKYGCTIAYGAFNTELRDEFMNKQNRHQRKKPSTNNPFQQNQEKNNSKATIMNSVMSNKRFALAESLYWELINSKVNRKLG